MCVMLSCTIASPPNMMTKVLCRCALIYGVESRNQRAYWVGSVMGGTAPVTQNFGDQLRRARHGGLDAIGGEVLVGPVRLAMLPGPNITVSMPSACRNGPSVPNATGPAAVPKALQGAYESAVARRRKRPYGGETGAIVIGVPCASADRARRISSAKMTAAVSTRKQPHIDPQIGMTADAVRVVAGPQGTQVQRLYPDVECGIAVCRGELRAKGQQFADHAMHRIERVVARSGSSNHADHCSAIESIMKPFGRRSGGSRSSPTTANRAFGRSEAATRRAPAIHDSSSEVATIVNGARSFLLLK